MSQWKSFYIPRRLVIKETLKGYLVSTPDEQWEFWIPKKIVHEANGMLKVSYKDDFSIDLKSRGTMEVEYTDLSEQFEGVTDEADQDVIVS